VPDKEGAAEEAGDAGLAPAHRRGQEGTGGRVATLGLLGGATGQGAYHGEEVVEVEGLGQEGAARRQDGVAVRGPGREVGRAEDDGGRVQDGIVTEAGQHVLAISAPWPV